MTIEAKKNPHVWLSAIDPPREAPPRRWRCRYCGLTGTYDEVRAVACSHVYPPCKTCGQAPECAPNCLGVLDALGLPGVVVLDVAGEVDA